MVTMNVTDQKLGYGGGGMGSVRLANEYVSPSPFGDNAQTYPGAYGNGIMGPTGSTGDWGSLGAYGKMGLISEGIGAFSSLANIYAGFKAMKLQKKQFKFQKDAWNKNYNNQVKDYSNNLKDRWAARSASAAARGKTFESMDSYVGDRALTGK